jgi:hypothetical protein
MNWKQIKNTNNRYEVSDTGLVRSMIGKGKALSPKTKSNGYKEVNLHITSLYSKMCYVHRLVAESFLGEIPPKYEVNHKDGDKSNNNLSNLEIVTCSQNLIHSYRVLGRKANSKQGSAHFRATVTEEIVLSIRDKHKGGATPTNLSLEYGVPRSTLCKIVYRATWKHI